MHTDRKEARTARHAADVGGGQRWARQVLATDLLVQDVQHGFPLLRASRCQPVGKRRSGQFGELLRFADVLLPRSRPLHNPLPQRIVMIGHRGEHRPNVVDRHIGAKAQDQGNAPQAGVPQPVLEKVRDVRRNGWMLHLPRRLTRQSARCVSGNQGSGERCHRLVLIQVLRCQIQTFVGRGHRDADGDQ